MGTRMQDPLNKGDWCSGPWCNVIKAVEVKCQVERMQTDCRARKCSVTEIRCTVVLLSNFSLGKGQEAAGNEGGVRQNRIFKRKLIHGHWGMKCIKVSKLLLSLKLLACCCKGKKYFLSVHSWSTILLQRMHMSNFSLLVSIQVPVWRVSDCIKSQINTLFSLSHQGETEENYGIKNWICRDGKIRFFNDFHRYILFNVTEQEELLHWTN